MIIGPDVFIECDSLELGDGVVIGDPERSDFRASSGVRIEAERLILKSGASIGREISIRGGAVSFGRNVNIRDWNDINVRKNLQIGADGTIGSHCEIAGVDVKFGRELWMLPYAKIGGGSAFEVHSKLEAGHFLHIGMYCILNTARPIIIGDEVGLGTRTALYTHGAYPDQLKGFPVSFGSIKIGDRSWLPGAVVNPGVAIGSDCVIAVGSVVTRDIPSGSLAAGIPARVIKKNTYPREPNPSERTELVEQILHALAEICEDRLMLPDTGNRSEIVLFGTTRVFYRENVSENALNELRTRGHHHLVVMSNGVIPGEPSVDETFIDLRNKLVVGTVSTTTERLLNQLRRHGIRFYCERLDDQYVMWQ